MKLILTALLAALIPCAVSHAQVENDARKIVEKYGSAVVTVDIVVDAKMTYDGQTEKSERKHSTTATIIDPSGLAVTSLLQVSPDSYMDPNDKADGYSYSFVTKDCRITTADGDEIPADVVLRDKDLDLAFIRPKAKPDKPLAYLDMTNSSMPQLLDQIMVLTRLSQSANHSIAAKLERVEAIVTKPRTFFVIGDSLRQFGVPAFTMDGKCAGIVVVRYPTGHDEDSKYSFYISVLPCSTVMNVAQQAKDAKPQAQAPAPAEKPDKPVAKSNQKPPAAKKAH